MTVAAFGTVMEYQAGHLQLDITPTALAIQLAPENYLQAKTNMNRCDQLGTEQRTLIRAVAHRRALHHLGTSAFQDLLGRSVASYLDSDEAEYLLFFINPNPHDPETLVALANDIGQQNHCRRRYEPLSSTPSMRPLGTGTGTTRGYVDYPGFRPAGGASDAVQFDSGSVQLRLNGERRCVYMALAFDESELDFFDLLRRGICPEALRCDHRIPTFGDAGLSSPAFLDLLSLVINLIGLIRRRRSHHAPPPRSTHPTHRRPRPWTFATPSASSRS